MQVLLIAAFIAVALFIIYFLILLPPRSRAPRDPSLFCDYAPRGLYGNGVPENSLRAFELACEAGVGIELDVQLSSDGEVVVFHDYELARMTGAEGKLCEKTSAELCTLSLEGSDQTIPAFSRVLETVGGKVPILIELKGEDLDTSLCEKTASVISGYNGAYCIESFNPLLIRAMKKYLPDAYYGLLYTDVCREKKKVSLLNIAVTAMATNCIARPDFIAYDKKYRRRFFVRVCTSLFRAGRFVWTVRGREELDEAKRLGECSIFENPEQNCQQK